MKERPILFNDAMVRAVLDGRKAQTRRVIHPHPWSNTERVMQDMNGVWREYVKAGELMNSHEWKCPYGEPGDWLWVREAWALSTGALGDDAVCVRYRTGGLRSTWVDGATRKYGENLSTSDRWRPSIHMPRWASRITLEVTGVRVERVQDITEADAQAEGLGKPFPDDPCAYSWFAGLWDSINANRGYGWDVNPWVWVIEFRRVTGGEA